jgi:tripartite ATP-independent transporter DctP family solute receptor
MKKILFLLLSLLILLVGCSSGGSGSQKTGITKNSGDKAEAINFTFAHNLQVETPQHQGALKFKELVEEKSGGALTVTISPAAQLGDEREVMQSVQTGAIESSFISTAVLSNISPVLQLPDLPFLVSERQTMYDLLDGEIGDELLDDLGNSGLKGTAFWESGFKQITTNNEIKSPSDLKGLQFRTMESQLIMDTYKELGANSIAIPFPEVYTSLQQGVVDGQENPLSSITSMKFYEVQDYLTLADIAYLGYGVIFNKDWFEGLSKEHQDILESASKEAAQFERQAIADAEAGFLDKIKESDTIINKLSAKQIQEFQEATKPVHEKYKSILGEKLMEKVYQFIKDAEK